MSGTSADLLVAVFAGTLNADRITRDCAEAQLYHLSTDPAFPCALLHFAASPTAADVQRHSVMLAAAVRLRNVIGKANWNRVPYFTDEVKRWFREHLLGYLCDPSLTEAIRRQVAATLQFIMEYDFPHAWPTLLPQVLETLNNAVARLNQSEPAAPAVLRGGLEALAFAAKHMSDATRCSEEESESLSNKFSLPLVGLVDSLISRLTACGAGGAFLPQRCLSSASSYDADATLWHSLRLAWKALSFMTAGRWPKALTSCDAASQLFLVECRCLQVCVDSIENASACLHLCRYGAEESSRQSQQVPAWRQLKWCVKLLQRQLAEMGLRPKSTERRARDAALLFSTQYVPGMVEQCCRLVWLHSNLASPTGVSGGCAPTNTSSSSPSGPLATTKAYIFALEILELAVAHRVAFGSCLEPRMPSLLADMVLPRLDFSAEDLELWQHNPEDYVRRQTDPRHDLFNPRVVCMGLVVTLCRENAGGRSSESAASGRLQELVRLLVVRMTEAGEVLQRQPTPSAASAAYFGCLYAVAQLKRVLYGESRNAGRAASSVDENVAWLLKSFVAPLLQSTVGYLRAEAVYVLGIYSDAPWCESEEYLTQVLQYVLPLLGDSELPVQIQTCSSLSKFVRRDGARAFLTPQIGAIIQQYFHVMRRMDHDGVVRTLRKTIRFYGDTLVRWAVELARMLVEHFLSVHENLVRQQRALEASTEVDVSQQHGDRELDEFGQDGDTVDSLMAADELIETLRVLVRAVPRDVTMESTMRQLQDTIAPLLELVLSLSHGANLGFMDGALHLLTVLVAQSTVVSRLLWNVVICLHGIVADGAFLDYAEQLVAPIDNLLSVDPDSFFTLELPSGSHGGLTPAGVVLDACKIVAQAATSWHHYAVIPPLIDAVLLHLWQKASREVPAAATTSYAVNADGYRLCDALLRCSMGVLSAQAASMPPTLQLAFANNILSAALAAPTVATEALMATQADEFVVSSIVQLHLRFSGKPSPRPGGGGAASRVLLRTFDRMLLVAALAALIDFAGASRQSEWSARVASWVRQWLQCASLLGDMAVVHCEGLRKELQVRTKAQQRQADGSAVRHPDDDDDDDDDDEWASDSDDSTDSDFGGSGDDFDDDEEDNGVDVEEEDDADEDNNDGGGAIRNQAQFAAMAARAQQLRPKDVDDTEDEDDTNYLADDAFESPIDDVNVWRRFADSMQRHASDLGLSLDALQAERVLEAAGLFDAVLAVRQL